MVECSSIRLFHFLAQFVLTTSETDLDYYNQKVNVRVASRVAERIEMIGFDGEYPTVHPKTKF